MPDSLARRSRHIAAFTVILLAAVALLTLSSPPRAVAQSGTAGSYITPFPKDDVYELTVFGDYYANGIAFGLSEIFADDKRVRVNRKPRKFTATVSRDFHEDLANLTKELKANPIPIAVVMTGGDDRSNIRVGNFRYRRGTPDWRKEYARRIDLLIKTLKRSNTAVYWVGLPVLRRERANEIAKMITEIIRERSYLNGIKFIESYNGFIDEEGGYSTHGPDLSGKIVRLRDGDGETFTANGNRKLAHFVERELKRDLVQAKAERAVPLLGNEADQQRINPEKKLLAAASAAAAEAKTKRGKGGVRRVVVPRGPVEQKADNARLVLNLPSISGAVKPVTIDIIRPAISASIIALVTRNQSASKPAQVGDSVPGILNGGLTVLSSITPASDGLPGGKRRLPPTHTPYFRALIKGEQLKSEPGRADDFRWPRAGAPKADAPAVKRPRAQGGPAQLSPRG